MQLHQPCFRDKKKHTNCNTENDIYIALNKENVLLRFQCQYLIIEIQNLVQNPLRRANNLEIIDN